MPRESKAGTRARALELLGRLKAVYPDAHCELEYRTPLELLIATILSAQCSDVQVNKVTADLFKKYRTAADYSQADPPSLENDLRRIGLFRAKAKNIQSACRIMVEQHGGEVPRTMEALTALAGVGRKTANVVLGNAFSIQDGVVVDTHVARLSERLGLSGAKDPVKIERELQGLIPREDWTLASHLLIWHGRRRCKARKPDCLGCELRELCPSAGKA
jgi:endonuclease III